MVCVASRWKLFGPYPLDNRAVKRFIGDAEPGFQANHFRRLIRSQAPGIFSFHEFLETPRGGIGFVLQICQDSPGDGILACG